VSVVASPTVIGNMSGAFKYMEFYPYLCWEQRLSKAVMAAHFKNLKPYLPANLKWAGSETLTQETLDLAASFQAPSGGMTYFRAEDEYVDPYLSAYTAIAFNWMRKSGYKIPEQVETNLQDYLINLLKNDAVPSFYSPTMTSTVRAVALAALAERGKANLADLERYQPHVKDMSLFGKSYFLQASLAIVGGEKYAPDVAKMILATSNQTGGKFVFNEVWDDSYTRILASPMREQCAILDAFVAYGERESGKALVGDVPFKLVRAITQDRKNRDYWQNTQENLFCGNALVDFARVYENEKTDMVFKAVMDDKTIGNAKFTDPRNVAVTVSRPNKADDAGRKTALNIYRVGSGRLYYATRLTYALPLELSQPANAGIEVHREYSVERDNKWQLLASPFNIKRGELVRVDLYLSVPAARNFVVVDDPVPGGLEPVNRDLATTSEVDARKADFKAAGGSIWFKYNDWIDFDTSRWSFYHQELRHDAARFYSDYLPPGNYHLSYAAQAIATGSFSAMPTMAQEMYDPDVYGKTEGFKLNVSEQDAKIPQ
jgi:alpha-2-macroglobulin